MSDKLRPIKELRKETAECYKIISATRLEIVKNGNINCINNSVNNGEWIRPLLFKWLSHELTYSARIELIAYFRDLGFIVSDAGRDKGDYTISWREPDES